MRLNTYTKTHLLSEYKTPTDYFMSGSMGVYSQTYQQYIITNSGIIFSVGDVYKNREYKYMDSQNDEYARGLNLIETHPERGTMIGVIVVETTTNGFDPSSGTHIELHVYMDEGNDHDWNNDDDTE